MTLARTTDAKTSTSARRTGGWDAWLEGGDDRVVNPTAATGAAGYGPGALNRRALLAGAATLGGAAVVSACAAGAPTTGSATGPAATSGAAPATAPGAAGFGFTELTVPVGADETHHVAPGHRADVLVRWGDPIFPDAPAFDPYAQTGASQARQFGYNCDFIGYLDVAPGPGETARALLCVNHEYTSREVMFPNTRGADGKERLLTDDELDAEMQAHGCSVVEIVHVDGAWRIDPAGRRNRRITATTAMDITGPARGNAFLRTQADPEGVRSFGTINNCAGGMTPWGTYLTAEENTNFYFTGAPADDPVLGPTYARFGINGQGYDWARRDRRFDLAHEPNEPHRFGWVVEIDPNDPTSTPKKRTALGRFKHEGAETALTKDGRAVVYMGDDQRGEYVYKFVSEGRFDPANPASGRDLLDAGDLYVGVFEGTALDAVAGVIRWEKLTAEDARIQSALSALLGRPVDQGDVLVHARFAADAVGATPMDRPEDVEPDARTGRAYVMLTNNSRRGQGDNPRFALNPANPRAENHFGHIIMISEANGDLAATLGRWAIVVEAGQGDSPRPSGRDFHPGTTEHGRFGSPDNCAVDPLGRLWIATDQGDGWGRMGKADALYGLVVEGPRRGLSKQFFRVPIGAELCGPRFTPDATSLFLAVQHPGTDGLEAYPPFVEAFRAFHGEAAEEVYPTMEVTPTRWPDFETDPAFNSASGKPMPPRPSVVVVTKTGGGVIGA